MFSLACEDVNLQIRLSSKAETRFTRSFQPFKWKSASNGLFLWQMKSFAKEISITKFTNVAIMSSPCPKPQILYSCPVVFLTSIMNLQSHWQIILLSSWVNIFSGHKSVVTVAFRAFLQSSNILTAHKVDLSVFAGVSASMKRVKSSLVTLKSNCSSSFEACCLVLLNRLLQISMALLAALARFKRKDTWHRYHHLIQDKTFVLLK